MGQSVHVKINDLLRKFCAEKIQKGLIIIFFQKTDETENQKMSVID